MRKLILVPVLLTFVVNTYGQVKYVHNVPETEPGEVAVSHNGKMLYMASGHDIIVYEMNAGTGKLTRKQSIQKSAEYDFTGLCMSPDDKYLYAQLWIKKSTGTSTLFLVYACNPQTGEILLQNTLDQQDNVNFDLTAEQQLSPLGNFMCIATRSRQDLYVYRRDINNGAFSYLSNTTGDKLQQFFDYAFSPDEKFIYVNSPNTYKHAIVYSIDQNNGALSKIQEVANPLKNEDNAEDLIVSPDGKNIYTVHKRNTYIQGDADYINQYSRDEQTGMLTYQNNYTNLDIKDIDRLYIDGSGQFIYAVSSFGSELHGVHVIKRDLATGSLIKQQSFSDKAPTDKLRGAFEIRFSQDNKFIYVPAARDNVLNVFENPNASGSVFTQYKVSPSNGISNQSDVNVNTNVSSNTRVNNQSTPKGTLTTLSKEQFNEVMKKLQAEQSDTKRLDMCYELLEGRSFKTMQAYSVGMLFNSEYKRLEFVKFASYFISDKENFKQLADLFSYENILNDFNALR